MEGLEEQVGSYVRNFYNLYRTFFPFRSGNRDLALYSPDYTSTRIMELPSCRDIGGEESHGHGFCPVDFLVPSYEEREWTKDGEAHRFRMTFPGYGAYEAEKKNPLVTPLTFYPFGFVAGCVWGDDNSWKIQYLDLSEAAEGRLKREERFGYLEMGWGLNLGQSVLISDHGEDRLVHFRVERIFHVTTGKEYDHFE